MVAPILSSLALVVSIWSLVHTLKSWRAMTRPLLTVVVETATAGNVATMLNIVVENHGSRPARNVRLRVVQAELHALFRAPPGEVIRGMVERCFTDKAEIPVLPPKAKVSNAFGFFSKDDPEATWKEPCKIDVVVTYQDLDSRRVFRQSVPLRIAENTSFATGTWSDPKKA